MRIIAPLPSSAGCYKPSNADPYRIYPICTYAATSSAGGIYLSITYVQQDNSFWKQNFHNILYWGLLIDIIITLALNDDTIRSYQQWEIP